MNPLIECLGWTLVHFVWQGVVIALLLAVALRPLRRAPSQQRYLAACGALALMVLSPLITANLVARHAQHAPTILTEPAPVAITPTIVTPQPATQTIKLIVTPKPITVREDFTHSLNSILPWLVMGWFVGVLALSCRLLAGWLQIRRWQRAASETLAEPWREKLAELARRLSISRPVRLVQSALVEVPTVIGWLRPVILLPAGCITGLSPRQLESILAHELAHIHRHDYLINLLQSAVETLLFYHPAVWWVSRRIREERENCCDDIAVKICGDPVAYARALATLEEMRSAPAQLAMAADGAPLLQRVQRLLGKSAGNATPMAWPLAGTIIIIALMVAVIGLRENRAMASEPPAPETFITTFGIYHFTNSGVAAELTIQTNRVFLSASKGTSLTTAGEGTWTPNRHWFVYIGKDWHIWAYDGAQGLWLIAADSMSSKMRSLEYLDEIPPDAVLKRLPKELKKSVLDVATPNDEKRREFEKLIREAEVQQADEFQKARLLFDSGKATEAEAKFKEFYENASNNSAVRHAAHQYLLLIAKRRMDEARKETGDNATEDLRRLREEYRRIQEEIKKEDALLQTNATTTKLISTTRTNVLHTSKGRQAILNKLKNIHLDSVEYDGWSVDQVFNNLDEQVRLHDPDKVGINFFFDRDSPRSPAPASVDPSTGLPLPNIESVKIKINPALTNASLGDVLNAIAKNSDIPLKYVVYDYGIGFSLGSPFDTRSYHIDAETLLKGLEKRGFYAPSIETNANPQIPMVSGGHNENIVRLHIAIRKFFASKGVYFPIDTLTNTQPGNAIPDEAIYFNDRRGILLVRATPDKMAKVDSILVGLTAGEAPRANTQTPSNQAGNAVVATNATFTVAATGTSPLSYQWYYNGTNVASPDKTVSAADEPEFLTRTYRLDMNSLFKSAKNTDETAHPQDQRGAEEALRNYFDKAGIDFRAMNSGDRGGYILDFGTKTLVVRAEKADLDKISKALASLAPKPLVNIKASFVEIDEAVSKTTGFNWLLQGSAGIFTTNQPMTLPNFAIPKSTYDGSNVLYNYKIPNSILAQTTGILTAPQFLALTNSLQARDGVNFLSAPEMTTANGMQGEIFVGNVISVVFGTNAASASNPTARVEYHTEPVALGPQLDLVPEVSDDGSSINLKLLATVTEFLGYTKAKVPVPQLSKRQLMTETAILDGQTLVLGGLGTATDKAITQASFFHTKSAAKRKANLLVFITPTLIYPDGTPIHPHAQ